METFYAPFERDDDVTVDTFLCIDQSLQTKDQDILRTVVTALKPADVNISAITCDKPWCNDRSCIRSGYEQWKRFDVCMDRIITREEEKSITYDFVIRTRPDVVLHTSLPPSRCWYKLRRDVIWDGDVQFFGGDRIQYHFGNIIREGTSTFIDAAQNADSVSAFLNIIPRKIADDFMRGIAAAYDECIPEVAHTAANLAIGGDELLKSLYGANFAGGCGKGNERWRWDECRILIQAQIMNVSLGRVQERFHTALARCRNGEVDLMCTDAFVQLTGAPLENVASRESCFPTDGYQGDILETKDKSVKIRWANGGARSNAHNVHRSALVDLDMSERLGGGAFLMQSVVMYEQFDGFRRGAADQVKLTTRDLKNSFYHLEKQGFAALGFDWIMLDARAAEKGMAALALTYDVLLITPAVLMSLPRRENSFQNKAIVYMDEPPDTTSFTSLRDQNNSTLIQSILNEALQRGVCNRCALSHFFTDDKDAQTHKYFPPVYDASIFDALYEDKKAYDASNSSSSRAVFFVQKRSAHADKIIPKMIDKGYKKLDGESWGRFSYAEYFENLRRARWVIALDASLSAGQVIAEASLLGVPTIAFAAKPNARLLLPDDLVIAHDSSAEDIIKFTMDVIDSYDSGMKSYDDLSALVREQAKDRLTRVDVHDLEVEFKSCCDSS